MERYRNIPMVQQLSDVPIHPHQTSDTIPTIYPQISSRALRLLLHSIHQLIFLVQATEVKKGHTHNPSGSNLDRRESVADSIPRVVGK